MSPKPYPTVSRRKGLPAVDFGGRAFLNFAAIDSHDERLKSPCPFNYGPADSPSSRISPDNAVMTQ